MKDPSSRITPAAFQILLSLADGQRHGYAIMQEVEQRTRGEVLLAPGTLYRSLHRLLQEGLVESHHSAEDASSADSRRRVYRITQKGVATARQETQRLQRLLASAAATSLLDPVGTDG